MFEKTFVFHSKFYLNSTLLFFTLSPTPISFGHPNTWSVHEMQPLQYILTIAAERFFRYDMTKNGKMPKTQWRMDNAHTPANSDEYPKKKYTEKVEFPSIAVFGIVDKMGKQRHRPNWSLAPCDAWIVVCTWRPSMLQLYSLIHCLFGLFFFPIFFLLPPKNGTHVFQTTDLTISFRILFRDTRCHTECQHQFFFAWSLTQSIKRYCFFNELINYIHPFPFPLIDTSPCANLIHMKFY